MHYHRMSRSSRGTTKYRTWLVCTGTNSIQIISGTNALILEISPQHFRFQELLVHEQSKLERLSSSRFVALRELEQ